MKFEEVGGIAKYNDDILRYNDDVLQYYLRITDYDGNKYDVVNSCGKIWSTSNYKVTHYNDGTPILWADSSTSWDTIGDCGAWYEFNIDNSAMGAYYKYGVVSNPLFPPSGWQVSSSENWTDLINCTENNSQLLREGTLWNCKYNNFFWGNYGWWHPAGNNYGCFWMYPDSPDGYDSVLLRNNLTTFQFAQGAGKDGLQVRLIQT